MSDILPEIMAMNQRHHLWQPHAMVIVAVSGGPDSLALLHALHRLPADTAPRLHIAHLDHGLRPESADDARFVADVAAFWGINWTIGHRDVATLAAELKSGVEAAARTARYEFLHQVATTQQANIVVVAHTADDQAETVLLRLLRGAGPTGLAAMRPRTVLANGLIVGRPLLHTSRATIEQYCLAHSLAPRHDPTNDLPTFARNRLRHELLPVLKTYNPHIVAALGRTAQLAALEDDFVTAELDQQWPTLATVGPGQVSMERAVFQGLHPALQRRALRRAVAQFGPLTELGADHLDRMINLARDGRGRLQLPARCWLVVDQAFVTVQKGQNT